MVNKKPITTALQEFSLFLMLHTRGHDVFIQNSPMNIDMTLPSNKQYQILFDHNDETIAI